MTDAKKNAEQLAETWLEAMSILSKKQIESVSFDKTIEATVTDATRASEGIYIVSTGNASFTAYTTEVGYKNNDAVMVTIPQGNYDKQKIIIGKQVSKQDGPIIYKSPFEKIVDVTNNIIQGEYQIGYWANGADYKWEAQPGYCIRSSAMEEILDEETRYCYLEDNTTTAWKLLQAYTAIQPGFILGQYDFSHFPNKNNEDVSNQFILTNDNINNWFEEKENTYIITDAALKEILQLGRCYYKKSSNATNWQVVTKQEAINIGDSIGQVDLDTITGDNNYVKESFSLTSDNITNWFFYNNGLPETTIKPFYSNEKCFYQNFSRLGLRAQFSTWLGEYDTIQGNYGLAIVLTFNYSVGDVNQEFSKVIQFDSNEFLGDPYNFETFYTQEQVFDISDFKDYPIVGIKLYAYQKNNFKSIDGDRIPAPNEDDFSIINPNIFVKSPYICLGNSVDDFETDTAEIMCDTALTYYKTATGEQQNRDEDNKKTIQLRWIHKDTNTDIIKAVEDDVLPENYEIRWYRYQAGAPSPDQFTGAHWQRFYGIKDEVEPTTGEWVRSQEDEDAATNRTEIIFEPNVNRQEERIKAIVIKNEAETISRLITSSNVLTFTNDNEVRNKVTLIDANALSIIFEDDEKGHYFLYDESGEIGKNEDTEVRILTAVFDERPDGERELDVQKKAKLNINECSKVVWTFPDLTMNTMIIPMDSANENAKVLQPDDDGNYIIDEPVQSVGFTIKKQLNNNATQNRIRLDITKDGQDYSAWVDPIFGTAGDNGSDYKVVLTWRNGKNALNLSKDNNVFLEPYIENIENNDVVHNDQTALIGDVVIFDQAGDVVDWPENATLKANWLVAEFGSSSIKQKEKEEEDIYYPVFKDTTKVLNNNLSGNPDIGYQPAGYYYFIDDTNQQGIQYYKFNYDSNDKIWKLQSANYNDTDQLYRKRRDDSEKKNKLEFRKVIFTTPPLKETGEYNEGHGNFDPIQIVEGKKQYYYSTNKKYFIKVNEQYILDPLKDYDEVETYYEPIEAKEKVYKLNAEGQIINSNNENTNGLVIKTNNENHTITIFANLNIDMNSLYILQLTLKNFGDYDLVSYYPIALKNGEIRDSNGQMTRIIQYIEGPDRVRYGSSGETDFKKNPYQIRTVRFENGNFVNYYHGYNNDNLQGYWRLLFPNNSESTNFDPVLIESKDIDTRDNHYVSFNKPLLSPSSVYIPDVRPYGVQFIDSNNVCLWTQPILVYQNKYPSRTLNKWNGKDIETDNGAGTITASGFAAGRKERDDNTFTGVVIGDWSRSKADTAITKNTGVYGFNHGAMSYAFKDDGTGFIGKDGSGRIYFDGNKSLIYSSKWKSFPSAQGMLLDIDDGVIDIRGPFVGEHQDQTQAQVYISPNPGRYLNIKDESGHDLLKISRNNYYLQTSDFDETGLTGVKLDLSSGRFIGYDFLIHAASSNGYIDINSGDTYYPLQIGADSTNPKFKVGWSGDATIEGHITANSGQIGNWEIEPTTPSANKQIIFNPNQNSISLKNDNYTTVNDEQVLATFSYAGTLHNSSDPPTVVLSSTGIIYGANLYGGKITGGEIYGGSLNPLSYTTGIGKNATTQNQIIELNGYLKVAPLGGLIIPRTSSTSGVESYLGSTTSYVTDDDSVYSGGISMRAVVTNTGEDQNNFKYINSEVKATGLNSGFSAGKYAAGDPTNGYLARVNSYVSAYVDTPSVKMETMSDANLFGGVGVSNYVRTFLNGIQIYAKTKSSGEAVTNAKIEINRENEEIELWANKTIYLKIDNTYFLKIYKDTDDNNKIKIATNIDAANQTGIYARFA